MTKVVDTGNVVHEVVQMKLTSPAIGKPPPKQFTGRRDDRWGPSVGVPISALLVNERGELFRADAFEHIGKQLLVNGTLKFGQPPVLAGSGPVVRISRAAWVGDGEHKQVVYTHHMDMLLILEWAEPLDAIADHLSLQERLEKPMPWNFDETPFAEVVTTWSEATGVAIKVDWEAMERAWMAPETPVTLHIPMLPAVAVFPQLFGTSPDYGNIELYEIDGGLWLTERRDDLGPGLIWGSPKPEHE